MKAKTLVIATTLVLGLGSTASAQMNTQQCYQMAGLIQAIAKDRDAGTMPDTERAQMVQVLKTMLPQQSQKDTAEEADFYIKEAYVVGAGHTPDEIFQFISKTCINNTK